MLEVRLLGQFDVRLDGKPIEIASRPAQSLLAYLILSAGTAHRREQLAGLFWPDTSETNARTSLRHALWHIRKALGASQPNGREYLLVDDISIAFNPGADYWLDVSVLEKKVTGEGSLDDLIGAVSVYEGDLLPGFYDEWIVLERERLRAVFEHKMKRLLDRLVEAQRWEDVLEWGERWIALGQTPEPAYRALMIAHSEQGNRSKVASAFERCVQAMRNELGVEPSEETRALYERLSRGETIPGVSPARVDHFAVQTSAPGGPLTGGEEALSEGVTPFPSQTPQARSTNLPVPLTSFVGREREIEEVKRLLSITRLLTLTGAGGSGKTRLVIAAANVLLNEFQDGVRWVELGALTDASLVPQAVAKVLGVLEVPSQPLSETLANYLRSKQLLLVLDNCEHLINICAQLVESLLSACPNLKIMVTSREALGISGERVFQVPTLSFPDPHQVSSPGLLTRYEAIRLFVERAVAVKSDFALSAQNAFAVAQVCQRLDGIPLAIELAAARVKMLKVEQIAARLGDRFRLLTSGSRTALPRHQTLRAAIDWSYDLLTEVERMMLRRLSVFAGGWTLEAAEAVCAGENLSPTPPSPTGNGVGRLGRGDVLDVLMQLANKSLVLIERKPDEEARYRMLETIREYARDKLVDAGEEEAVRNRHLEFFVRLVEEAEPKLLGAEQMRWFNRLETEYDNIRAVLDWSMVRNAADTGLQLAGTVRYWWFSLGHYREGLKRSMQILSSPIAAERTSARAKVLNTAGFLQWACGNPTEARPLLEEALTIGRELGDKLNIAWSLLYLGAVVYSWGGYAAARPLLEEGLVIGRELGPTGMQGAAWSLAFLGDGVLYHGDYERAKMLYEESAALLRELGDINFLAYVLRRLGQVALHQGDSGRATVLCKESLTVNIEVGHKQGIAACLAALAGISAARGQTIHTVKLLGAVEALLEAIALPLLPPDHIEYDRNMAALYAQLDAETFAAAWAEGRAMTLEQAIAYGLEEAP